MSGSLKDVLGLPEAKQSSNSESVQDLREQFLEKMGGLNQSLQLIAGQASPQEFVPLDSQRLKLYEAFQKTSTLVDQGDPATGKESVKRMLTALETIQTKVADTASRVSAGHDQWLAREDEFDILLVRIGELEDGGNPKAATLRKLADSIRTRANERDYKQSVSALNQLRPKFDQIYEQHQDGAGATDSGQNGAAQRTLDSPAPGADAAAHKKEVLKVGSQGPAVKCLQKLLGEPTKVDGKFGPATQRAVKDFQKSKGLKADGIVGEKTWSALGAGSTAKDENPKPQEEPQPAPAQDMPSSPGATGDVTIDGFEEFAVDVADIRDPAAQEKLRSLAHRIVASQQTPQPISGVVVHGHADFDHRTDPSKREQHEMEVSRNRSQSALEILVKIIADDEQRPDVAGVIKQNSKTEHFGSKHRIHANAGSESQMKENRRVEFFLVSGGQPTTRTGKLTVHVVLITEVGRLPVRDALVKVLSSLDKNSKFGPIATDDDGRVEFDDLPVGQYSVSAQVAGDKASRGEVTISEGVTEPLILEIASDSPPVPPDTRKAIFTVTNEVSNNAISNATVSVAGQSEKTGNTGQATFSLPPGKHSFTVEADGFDPFKGDLEVTTNEETLHHVELKGGGGDGDETDPLSATPTVTVDSRTKFGLDIDPSEEPILAQRTVTVNALVGAPGEPDAGPAPVGAPQAAPKGSGDGTARFVVVNVPISEGDTPRTAAFRAMTKHFDDDEDKARKFFAVPTSVVTGKLTPADFKRGSVNVRIRDTTRRTLDAAGIKRKEGELKKLSETAQERVDAEADALFTQRTGIKTRPTENQKVMFDEWQQFRVEALQRDQLANLPEHVKAIFKFSKDGVTLEQKDFQRVLDLADRLQELSPDQIADYANRSTATTEDVEKYLDSVESYIKQVKSEEDTADNLAAAENPLLGREELYRVFKLAHKRPDPANPGEMRLVFEAQKELPALLKAAGMTDKTFGDAIEAYKRRFEAEAVSEAKQGMERREHDIFTLRTEAVKDENMPGAVAALDGLLLERQRSMARHEKPGEIDNNAKIDMEAVRNDMRVLLEERAKKDPTVKMIVDFSRLEDPAGKGRISDDFVDMLSQAVNEQQLKQMLEKALKDREKAIKDTRDTLKKDPEQIWGFDKAISKSKAKSHLGTDDIGGQIVDDKQTEVRGKKIAIAVGLGVAAVIAGIASGGTGAVAVAAAAVDLGLAGYGAYTAVVDYQQENAAHLSGLSETPPSLSWVVVALVGVPLSALSAGSKIAKLARFQSLGEGAMKAELISELLARDGVATKLEKFNADVAALKNEDEAKKLVARLQKELAADLADKGGDVIAAIILRAEEEASVLTELAKLTGGNLGAVLAGKPGDIAKKLGPAVYRAMERQCRTLREFLNQREFKAMGLTLEALEKDAKSMRKVEEAVNEARKNAETLSKAARANNLSPIDVESVALYWAQHPTMSAEEVAGHMPVFLEARESLGDLSKVVNLNAAYAEKLAEGARISAEFRRLKLSGQEIKDAMDYRKQFPDAPVEDFIDVIQFFKSAKVKPTKRLGSPAKVLRNRPVVTPRGKAFNPSPADSTSTAGRRVSASQGMTIDKTTRETLESVGLNDQVAGTGAIDGLRARPVTGDENGAVIMEITGDPASRALQRDLKEPLASGQRYAPSFNRDGTPLTSIMAKNGSEASTLKEGTWHRLHLWGPGFGDEAKAGMFIGPIDLNLAWQNSGVENLIRELSSQVSAHPEFRFRIKASASTWGRRTPGGLFLDNTSEQFVKNVKYELELTGPNGLKKEARIELELLTDPADIHRGKKAVVDHNLKEAVNAVNDLFSSLPARRPAAK
jgi:hypothetical protein